MDEGPCQRDGCTEPGRRRLKGYLTCLSGMQMKIGAIDMGILCDGHANPKCRCGWKGVGVHQCHRCGVREGEAFVIEYPPKVAAAHNIENYETVACQECRPEFVAMLQEEERRVS